MNASLSCSEINTQLPVKHHPLLNLLGIVPAALVITAVLLYAMHLLVHKDYPVIAPKPVPIIPEVVADFPKDIKIIPEPLPVKPIEQAPPPRALISEPVEVDPESNVVFIEPVIAVKPPMEGAFGMSGQMVPFIKIAPQYPQTAAAKGIEGYVDIMFDVTALGTTENIRIIAYVPSAVFNKSVIKAVKGWKYKPNVVDDAPVKTYDVKDRVRFSMEK